MNKIKIKESKTIGHINPKLHSQFIEFLGSCIYDGIWVGENSEIPNYNGMRKDVVDGLKELAPPVIRWPGGCYADTYHWRDGIGPREDRPITYNENFGTFTQDKNQFGTHEFMELCRRVGAEPWLNVNMMTGSAGEMREWMEYCNREEDTTLSSERAKNGSKKAFQVKYWGIGNESWCGGGNATAESYADVYRQYASAIPLFHSGMPGHENEKILRIACGPDGNRSKERVEWTGRLFQALKNFRQPPLDALDLHFYNWNITNLKEKEDEFEGADWYRVINSCLKLEEVILEQKQLIEEGLDSFEKPEVMSADHFDSPPKCRLVVGEWGNWHGMAFQSKPALYQQCSMRDAITSALTLDIFHRNCSHVEMACVAQTVNVLNSLFLTKGKEFVKTPNYDVFKMYMVHRDASAIECECEEENTSEEGRLFIFASIKDHIINFNVINTDFKKEKEACIQFEKNAALEEVTVLNADSPKACNTFQNPDRVRAKSGQNLVKAGKNPVNEWRNPINAGKEYQVVIPPASVSVYRFRQED